MNLSTHADQFQHYKGVKDRLSPKLTVLVKRPEKNLPAQEEARIRAKIVKARDWLFVASTGIPSGFRRKAKLTVITARSVEHAIADYHNITTRDLTGSIRTFNIVHARHHLWHFLFHDMGFNYQSIGRYYGRDHTTIRHGVLQHKRRSE